MVQGDVRLSCDKRFLLDFNCPGRIHHFTSYLDLVYWDRYERSQKNHELRSGKISTFSPFIRFTKGMSIFHQFATNPQVLSNISSAIMDMKKKDPDNPVSEYCQYLSLYQEVKTKKTALHWALDNQSPVCLDIMLKFLLQPNDAPVSNLLIDMIDDLIGMKSPVVNKFMNNAFFVTH